MVFSRIWYSSLSRSAQTTFRKNVICGKTSPSGAWLQPTSSLKNACIAPIDGVGAFSRRFRGDYLTHIGPGKLLASNTSYHWKLRSALANTLFQRFFFNEATKIEKYGSDFPKDEKEIPKKEEPKTKGASDHGHGEGSFLYTGSMILLSLIFMYFFDRYFVPQRISLERFKDMLCEPGLVDHIVVAHDSTFARVYIRTTPHSIKKETELIAEGPTDDDSLARENKSKYKYFFYFYSKESFEEEMEEVRKSLQIDPHDYVSVVYESESEAKERRKNHENWFFLGLSFIVIIPALVFL